MVNKPRPKPRWNYRPPGFRSQAIFIRERVQELAAICGRNDEGGVTKLSELLNDEDAALQYVKYVYETDVSVPEQRAALQKLATDARSLVSHIEKADLDTRQAIYSTYPNTRLVHENNVAMDNHKLFSRDVEHLKRLCGAIEHALGMAKGTGGNPGLGHLFTTCRVLAEVYERFSGRRFTFDRPVGPDEKVEFITEGTRFVAAAALVIWPDVTIANLTTAMRQIKLDRASHLQKPPRENG